MQMNLNATKLKGKKICIHYSTFWIKWVYMHATRTEVNIVKKPIKANGNAPNTRSQIPNTTPADKLSEKRCTAYQGGLGETGVGGGVHNSVFWKEPMLFSMLITSVAFK